MTRIITGIAPLAERYDGFIVDLWGVVHDGFTVFPGALECLRRLAGRPVLLLSNAPRRADSVQRTLRRLGIEDALYTHILTSGEATWLALRDRTDPWFAALGTRVYHLGPERDRGVVEGLGLTLVANPAAADFLLNTGPDDQRDTAGLNEFTGDLHACLGAGLKMICANPDLEIVRGGARILCAGALAAWYEAQGGEVRWIGKPDRAIYHHALACSAWRRIGSWPSAIRFAPISPARRPRASIVCGCWGGFTPRKLMVMRRGRRVRRGMRLRR